VSYPSLNFIPYFVFTWPGSDSRKDCTDSVDEHEKSSAIDFFFSICEIALSGNLDWLARNCENDLLILCSDRVD
jgi:hypothetical protein